MSSKRGKARLSQPKPQSIQQAAMLSCLDFPFASELNLISNAAA